MRDREESAAPETGTLWNISSCLFKKLEFSKWSAGFYIENRFSEAVSMHCQVWLFFFFDKHNNKAMWKRWYSQCLLVMKFFRSGAECGLSSL